MSKASSYLIHAIRTMAGAYKEDRRGDADLLASYVAVRDETAFTTLMMRHGPMVWGVCSRILGKAEDVEEAHQVTFLALAQQAAQIHVTESLGGWLHQVARRTALNARQANQVRKGMEQRLKDLVGEQAIKEKVQDDAHELLHAELAKLSEKLRTALVLHYLEGKTLEEVADILGVKKAAVWNRLERGKATLQVRLRRRGVMLEVAAIGAMLAETALHAAMPPGLVAKTMQAASAFQDGKLTGGLAKLAQKVLKHAPPTAPWWKTGWVIGLLCITGLGLGAGGVAWRAGFFATKADDPTTGSKKRSMYRGESEGIKSPRVDRYGDLLPPGALMRLGTTRFRSFQGYQPPLFTHDGKGLLTCISGGPARLCNAVTGEVLREFGSDVRSVALSADGVVLAGRSPDEQGGLCIWDAATGKLLRQIDLGSMDWSSHLTFSPNGKIVASAGYHSRTCAVELATGNVLWSLPRNYGASTYSTDDAELLVFDGKNLDLLDARSGSRLGRLGPDVDQGVTVVYACSADARLAVFASPAAVKAPGPKSGEAPCEREISFWDVKNRKERSRFKVVTAGNDYGIRLALSPDKKILALVDLISFCEGSIIRLFDIATGKELRRCRQFTVSIGAISFSPNGKVVAANCSEQANSENLHLWDVESGKEITPNFEGHTGAATSLVFTPDGKELVSGGADGMFRAWNAASGIERLRWGRFNDYWSCVSLATAVIAPDGRTAAVYELGFDKNRRSHRRSIIRIIRREGDNTKEIHKIFPPPPAGKHHLFLSPDGRTLAVANLGSGFVHIWDLSTGKELPAMAGGFTAFSPDGKTLAFERDSPGIAACVQEVRTGIKLCTIPTGEPGRREGHRGWAFSPDGRVLAGVAGDDKVRLWDLQAGDGSVRSVARNYRTIEIASTNFRDLSSYVPLVFSPDGRMLAASDGDNCVRVWETATGLERLRFYGHENEITSIAFAPDGRRLASGAKDTSILIWDLTSGRLNPDGTLLPCKLSRREMETTWSELLLDKEARRAARAAWAFASGGSAAIRFLEKQLKQLISDESTAKIFARLISELDAPRYQVRKRAFDRLAEFGEACEYALTRVLHMKPSLEVRRQIESLLDILEGRRAGLASVRTVAISRVMEILGHIGSPEARRLLQKLTAEYPLAP